MITLKSNPKISVLMSVYNGEKWLDEAIQSVLQQTFTNFEFIIVNDGSTDDSLEMIFKNSIKDPRIKVFDKPKTGLADSLNYGIERCKGDWIARIDADDLCEPHRLSIQYDKAKSYPDLVLIGSGLTQIDENGKRGREINYPDDHLKLTKRLTLLNKGFFPHSSAFIRNKSVIYLGGYRCCFQRAQDYDLWLRLSELGKIGCVEQPLVRIRHHTNQISHDQAGMRQIIDSRVALVSYYLRLAGVDDPASLESSDAEFDVFRNYVLSSLAKESLFELSSFVKNIKKNLSTKSILGLMRVISSTIISPNLIRIYISKYVYGEKFSKKISEMYIRGAKR